MEDSEISSRKDYCINIMSKIFEMLYDPHLCDMSIAVETEVFWVHKCVLVAACPMIHSIVMKEAESSTESNLHLSLDGISVSEFKTLLAYIYTCELPEEHDKKKNRELISACEVFGVQLPTSYTEKKTRSPVETNTAVASQSPSPSVGILSEHSDKADSDWLPDEADNCLEKLEDVLHNKSCDLVEEEADNIEHQQQNISNNKTNGDGDTDNDFDKTLPEKENGGDLLHKALVEVYILTGQDNSPNKDDKPSSDTFDVSSLYSVKRRKIEIKKENEKVNIPSLPKRKKFSKTVTLSVSNPTTSTKPSMFLCCVDGCGKSYDSQIKLINHRRCHKEKKYVCVVCGKKFLSSKDLKVHGRIHTNEKPFECATCNAKFAQKITLKNHMDIHKETRDSHPCSLCHKKYTSERTLHLHVKMKHKEKNQAMSNETNSTGNGVDNNGAGKPYRCKICGSRFTRKDSLLYHLETHNDNRHGIKCALCQRSYISRKSFNTHIKRNHPDGGVSPVQSRKTVPLIVNDKTVVSGKNSKTISGKRARDSKFMPECSLCNSIFNSLNQYRTHIESDACAGLK